MKLKRCSNTITNIWHFSYFCVSHLETCTHPTFKMSSFFLIQYLSSISDKITIPFLSLHHLPIGFLTSFLSRSCVCLSLANLLTHSLYLYLSSISFIVDWPCMVLFVNWKTFSTLSKSLSYILIYDFRFIYDVNITFFVNMSKCCYFALIYISFKIR